MTIHLVRVLYVLKTFKKSVDCEWDSLDSLNLSPFPWKFTYNTIMPSDYSVFNHLATTDPSLVQIIEERTRVPSQRWYEVTQNSPIPPPRCKAFWNCSGTVQCTSDLFPKRPVAVFRETKKNVGSIYLIIFNGEKKDRYRQVSPTKRFLPDFWVLFFMQDPATWR